MIEHNNRYEVVGEAQNGAEALEMVMKLDPDLVVVDISLPDQSGIDLTREIRKLLPETRILIVSMHSKIDYVVEAFQVGATGYVVKESTSESLLQGLEQVSKGEYYLDSSLSQQVVKKLFDSQEKENQLSLSAYGSLTPREQEVMRLLAEGFSSKKVAEKLFISPKTVDNYRTSILNKLDLRSTVELVRYAAKLGLIDMNRWKE